MAEGYRIQVSEFRIFEKIGISGSDPEIPILEEL
jgi:hypothetical protein